MCVKGHEKWEYSPVMDRDKFLSFFFSVVLRAGCRRSNNSSSEYYLELEEGKRSGHGVFWEPEQSGGF